MSTNDIKSVLAQYDRQRILIRRRLLMIAAIPLLCAIAWLTWMGWTIHQQNARIQYLTGVGGKVRTTPVWPHDLVAGLLGENFAAGCVTISVVDLGGTSAGDEALTYVRGLHELDQLRLNNSQVTDAGLRNIKSLERLTMLHLANTQITDAGLESLSQLRNLELLFLTNTRITDAGLHHLASLSHLTDLDLSGTSISNRGLADLSRLSALEELLLVNTSVTDDGVLHMFELKHLDHVDLRGTAVTYAGASPLEERGVTVYQSAGPNLRDLLSRLQSVNRLIEKDGSTAETIRQRAYVHRDLGEHDAAIADFEQALQLGCDTAELQNDLAVEYSTIGRTGEAIQHYTAAINHEPGQVVYFLNRGGIFLETGQLREAIADLSKAIEIDPNDYRAYALRYDAYQTLGESELARRDAIAAHRLNGDWTVPPP